ncbi:hypothetical protein FS837_000044 [Tulasnella sp. UAMH 9824]|nr:hypothetical protein FS837_000044 [Tulasnella sp. UAMH 9824]
MSLRPPSTSPSPSPGPHNGNPRASLQPQPRGTAANAAANLAPIATRREFTPGARPTSELLSVGPGAFQTPESEAIDQWFENLQNYEATLEEMAAASLDVNFKEELSAIEQWFRVLSEAERTAALYSLLQHSTQVQIRFFITVLQQMARSDPMTALLSPAMGSSMQVQMEAKLASMGLKSPGLPQSPGMRTSFGPGTPTSASRQSLSVDPSTFLSPDSASKANNEAAAQLAQQRAKFKANNAAHRLSAPGPLISEGGRPQSLWAQSSLAQVAERAPSPATSDLAPSSTSVRPKSTDFTGLANQFARSPRQTSGSVDDTAGTELDISIQELRLNDQLSPMVGGNWASMVNTPMVPMFGADNAQASGLDAAAAKLANWSMGNGTPSSRVVLDDAKKFRRESKGTGTTSGGTSLGPGPANGAPKTPKEDGNTLAPPANKWKANSSSSTASGPSWRAGNRSPSNAGSTRFGGSDAGSTAASSFAGGQMSPAMGLGMGMGNFGGMYGGMGMGGLGDMAGLQQQQALQNQMLAAQLGGAFSPQLGGGFPANPMAMGMGNFGMNMGMGVQGQPGGPNNRTGRGGSRAGGAQGSASTRGGAANKAGRPAAKPKAQLKDDDINITLLNDIPTWFHTLRLHKYTPVVQGKNWKELVVMGDKDLEELGITALGARRKLLKHFVVVRNKFDIPHPEGAETGAEASDDEEDGGPVVDVA